MTLPYLARLLCLCFSFFFLLNAVAALLVRAFSSHLQHSVQKWQSSAAADFLLAVRLLPFAGASIFVVFFCVPSYLRLEPNAAAEYVGLGSVLLGGLGLGVWALAIVRAARAFLASLFYRRRIERSGGSVQIQQHGCRVFVVETARPLLALAGLFRSRLFISRALLESLSPAELDAALTHEQAHRVSRDNLKRLLFLLAPDVLPFVNPLGGLEQAWSKFTEWAADDSAASGNSDRALSLAGALLRAARLGAAPSLPYLSTSLLANDHDLEARVDRLLAPIPATSTKRRHPLSIPLLGLLLGVLFLAPLAPATLTFVHELQELLLR